jgi:hypothetical protein
LPLWTPSCSFLAEQQPNTFSCFVNNLITKVEKPTLV